MRLFSFSRFSQIDIKWGGRFNPSSDELVGKHKNPYHELIIVSEGPIHLCIEGEKHTLHSGEGIFLKPWETHYFWDVSSRTNMFWVQFDITLTMLEIEPSEDGMPAIEEIFLSKKNDLRGQGEDERFIIPRKFHLIDRYNVFLLFEKMLAELKSLDLLFRYRLSYIFAQIIELIALEFYQKLEKDISTPGSYKTYRRMVDYLNEFYTDNEMLNKEHIERTLERNYDYVSQLFKKYSGITVVNYIQKLRILQAQYMLDCTDQSIQDISTEIGYQDPFYFSKVFKKDVGVSPSQYRTLRFTKDKKEVQK
jgi:AraC-like DNA-binding protein